MTERDWIGAVIEDPVTTLPVLKDWFLDGGDEAGAAFCQWFLNSMNSEFHYVSFGKTRPWAGPRGTSDHKNYYWCMIWFDETLYYRPDNGLPDPLWNRNSSPTYYPTQEAAWEGALKAWRKAYSEGHLDRWLGK